MLLNCSPPAKINLGLHVLRKRTDGFHDIETVFFQIAWCDRLSVKPAADLSMTCSDAGLPTDDRNLCVKAARLLRETHAVREGASLHLEKHIPYGAGLGGGSSDAAHTLRLLARLWRINLPAGHLMELAASLGSDVPCFIETGVSYAEGRGERISPMAGYRFPFALVVVAPAVHVATGAAYAMVHPRADDRADLREVVASNDLARWRRELANDFEAPVCAAYPEIAAVKNRLMAAGAGYASMSGSGSAVFGVFEDTGGAAAAAEMFGTGECRVWHGEGGQGAQMDRERGDGPDK